MFEKLIPDIFECSECKKPIEFGTKRYKSKKTPKYSLCATCITNNQEVSNFFEFENTAIEAVFHDWNSCNECNQFPIRGPLFHHLEQAKDLCEGMC